MIKFTRFILTLILTLGAVGLSTSPAFAAKPVITEFDSSGTGVLTGVCPFPIHVHSTFHGFEIDHFDRSGRLTRISIHQVEQDTFTANGNTLIGLPFTFNIQVLFDSSGNVTNIHASGVVQKIPLPDGSLFISAGRVDYTQHPGATFILSADRGNPGNIAGFCAALSQ